MEKIRVTVSGNHKPIAFMLSETSDMEVVGCFRSGEELLKSLDEVEPQVALIGVLLAGMPGFEVARRLRDRHANVKVILLAPDLRKEYLEAAIKSGIDGYLIHDVECEVLCESIRSVHRGETFFPKDVRLMVFEDFCNRNGQHHEPVSELTRRETDILCKVASAKSNREIAGELGISVKTVEAHKSNILNKLGFKTSAELIKYAVKNSMHG